MLAVQPIITHARVEASVVPARTQDFSITNSNVLDYNQWETQQLTARPNNKPPHQRAVIKAHVWDLTSRQSKRFQRCIPYRRGIWIKCILLLVKTLVNRPLWSALARAAIVPCIFLFYLPCTFCYFYPGIIWRVKIIIERIFLPRLTVG